MFLLYVLTFSSMCTFFVEGGWDWTIFTVHVLWWGAMFFGILLKGEKT